MKNNLKMWFKSKMLLLPLSTILFAVSCKTEKDEMRTKNFSAQEIESSEYYKKLSKTKKLKNWSDDSFLKSIKEKNFTNLTYADELQEVKFNAPFNKNTKSSNVLYQITVYSFADGNGDGIGDFIGLKNNLDYFSNLGIDTLYLSPIHPASSYHGYDVIDYSDVAPELGGMQAFDDFLQEAHKHGIKVVMDMIFNHTSLEHPWFQKALEGNKEYQEYYNFYEKDKDPYPSEGSSDVLKYFINYKLTPQQIKNLENLRWVGTFWGGMPDLNLKNPKVVKEISDIHEFWAKKGVDGFRYDAFYHYFDRNNSKKVYGSDYDLERLFIKWREAAENGYKDDKDQRSSEKAFMFGEWWKDPAESKNFWGDFFDKKDGLDSVIDGTKWKYKTDVSIDWQNEINVLKSLIENKKTHHWMPFLDNHDVERWINHYKAQNGSKATVTPHKLTQNERNAYESAVFSLLSRGGYPILYNGNEILMQGAPKAPDVNVREPWYWKDDTKNVIFKDRRDPGSNENPNFISPKASIGEGYVEDILQNPDSSYNLVSKLIKLRQEYESIREQKIEYIANPIEVIDFASSQNISQNQITLRKNPDGTFLLITYSNWDADSTINLKSDYIVEKVLIKRGLAIQPQKSQIKLETNNKNAVFLIKHK
ncbi:alpha-amylase family glycosyl hydrolase [Mycoplasma leonicaptivi]|uniref:alpha-amylase family glycosyl hydrolase n=1 Tax=Mycoplasma leonicaptivi TaxID=36742 RepID=UPI000687C2EE|nr:alpha-amylase family glycosyl hydrolase [Mycoplasma leonicaptivi]